MLRHSKGDVVLTEPKQVCVWRGESGAFDALFAMSASGNTVLSPNPNLSFSMGNSSISSTNDQRRFRERSALLDHSILSSASFGAFNDESDDRDLTLPELRDCGRARRKLSDAACPVVVFDPGRMAPPCTAILPHAT